MRLAEDDIIASVGSEPFSLRPTLRAALRLERDHDGFDKLLRSILSGHLTTIVGVIAETSIAPTSVEAIQAALKGRPLCQPLARLTTAALAIVMRIGGFDREEAADGPSEGPRTPFRDFHMQLFRIATGNLGWTPDVAWNATPAEILEAHHGRVDLLRSIFGSADKKASEYDPRDEERDEAGIAELKAMSGSGLR